MRIGVVGGGYVGLVSGAGFASMGLKVTCVDIDEAKIASLRDGKVPFFEPGLGDLINDGVQADRLSFTTDIAEAVHGMDAVFLAVGTPMGDDGAADLSYLFKAGEDVAKAADGDLIIVIKSTVPPGTSEKMRALAAKHTQHTVSVASNPEFLKEGDAVNDFLKPDRIVIGADDERARKLLEELYRPFVMREHRVLTMDTKSSELTKYAANTMLATRISFMNEVAAVCEAVGADIELVRAGISSDKRIGSAFLYAGVGYGGSCFPKDVSALIETARAAGVEARLARAVDDVNRNQRGLMLDRMVSHFDGKLDDKVVTVWGLSFKPRTDDVREAPAITLIEGLTSGGAKVRAHDPVANANAGKVLGDRADLFESAYESLDGADALAVMTEWPQFRLPDWVEVKRRMRTPSLFDGRNIYQPDEMRERGFFYYGVGRR